MGNTPWVRQMRCHLVNCSTCASHAASLTSNASSAGQLKPHKRVTRAARSKRVSAGLATARSSRQTSWACALENTLSRSDKYTLRTPRTARASRTTAASKRSRTSTAMSPGCAASDWSNATIWLANTAAMSAMKTAFLGVLA